MPAKSVLDDTDGVVSFKVLVNGQAIPAESEVAEIRVHQVVAGTSLATVALVDEDFKLLDSSLFDLGGDISIELGYASVDAHVFSGEITSVSVAHLDGPRHSIVVEAMDKSHRLARGTRPDTYLDRSYADIISQICNEEGVSVGKVEGPNLQDVKHPYIMRSGTAFEFFDRIALQTGAHWFMDQDGKLNFIERTLSQNPVVSAKWGESIIRFKARYSDSGRVDKVVVNSWDYLTKTVVTAEDKTELEAPTGGPTQPIFSKNRKAFSGTRKIEITTSGAASAQEATMLAKSIGRRQAMNELTMRVEVQGTALICAGAVVTIDGVGTKLSGDHYVATAEHVLANGNYLTRFTTGGLQGNGVVDLLRSNSAAGLTPWSSSMVVIGVVTNNNDEEEQLGRVKVRFPMFSGADESTWARVLHPGAGSGRGMHFIPNIDDEVLVAFEQGDMRRPVVLGGLWNGTAKPWSASTANLDSDKKSVQWGIMTRTGHEMVFNEDVGDDKNSFLLKMKDGTLFHVGHDKVELISKNAKPIEVKTGDADLVMKDGNVTLKGKDITIEATGNLTLKATGNIDATAKSNARLNATASLELKGNAGVKVESAAILELKGSMTKIN